MHMNLAQDMLRQAGRQAGRHSWFYYTWIIGCSFAGAVSYGGLSPQTRTDFSVFSSFSKWSGGRTCRTVKLEFCMLTGWWTPFSKLLAWAPPASHRDCCSTTFGPRWNPCISHKVAYAAVRLSSRYSFGCDLAFDHVWSPPGFTCLGFADSSFGNFLLLCCGTIAWHLEKRMHHMLRQALQALHTGENCTYILSKISVVFTYFFHQCLSCIALIQGIEFSFTYTWPIWVCAAWDTPHQRLYVQYIAAYICFHLRSAAGSPLEHCSGSHWHRVGSLDFIFVYVSMFMVKFEAMNACYRHIKLCLRSLDPSIEFAVTAFLPT